jgi:hypothetical protein
MQLSLQIICNRLKLPFDLITTIFTDKGNPKFSNTRLLLSTTKVLHCGTLYVGNAADLSNLEFETGTGLLIAGEPPPDTPCIFISLPTDTDICGLFNAVIGIFEQFNDWNTALQTNLLEQQGFQSLIEILGTMVEHPAYLVDSSFKVMEINGSPLIEKTSDIWKCLKDRRYLPLKIIAGLHDNNKFIWLKSNESAILRTSPYFNRPFICRSIWHDGSFQGLLFIVQYDRRLLPSDFEIVEYFVKVLSKAFFTDQKHVITRGAIYEHFMIDMLNGTLKDKDIITDQLSIMGWQITGTYYLFKCEVSSVDELMIKSLCSRLENVESGKPLYYDGSIVSIFSIQNSDHIPVLKANLSSLLKDASRKGALSDCFFEFHRLHEHYRQASVALEFGIRLHPDANLFSYSNYAVFDMLKLCENSIDLFALCHKALFCLRDYDKQHGAEYLRTLYEYIRNERSLVKTAAALYIHKNSLSYRLDKMLGFLNIDLEDSNTRMHLLISFSIFDYLKSFNRIK